MRNVAHIAGLLMFAISTGALAVADPESVSLQDLKPECKERHPTVSPEHCMIQDRLPSRQYVRRAGETTMTVPTPPAPGERQPASAVPSAVRPFAAPR